MSYSGNLPGTLNKQGPLPALVLETEPATLPKHLARLPGGQWALWRWVALRGAGFPAAQIHQLADPECALAARQLIEAEDAADRVRFETSEQLKRIKQETDSTNERRTAAQKVLRRLWKGSVPRPDEPFGNDPLIETLRSACNKVAALRASFNQEFTNAVARNSRVIYELASSSLFKEAVIWQNRKAYHNGISWLLRHDPAVVPRNNLRIRNEELIATYLQRYCLKNDTIGFFGPVGWARLVSHGAGVEMQPGDTLVAKRHVHPESWSIDKLTEILSADESLRRWCAPRLLPFFRIEGTTLHHPFNGPVTIQEEYAAVLAALDGIRTAVEIAVEIVADPAIDLETEEEVFAALSDLCDEGFILWEFECPVAHAEQHLLRLIERIGDDQQRLRVMDLLRELQLARANVAAAAGNPTELDQNIAALEDTFERLTGATCTRSHGEMYAARTLVYEDCERALDVQIGPDVLEALGPPLSLLLDSARWFTFDLARRYREVFTNTYSQLVKETGSTTVEAVAFWHRIQPLMLGKEPPTLEATRIAFQDRWASVLSLSYDEWRVNYTSEELRSRVQDHFATPSAGWRLGRYQCPDVMIAAENAAAIGRGDYQFIAGELHLGGNTLAAATFAYHHPAPGELIEAYECDLPEPCVIPISPRQWPGVTARTAIGLISPKDYRLALSYDALSSASGPSLPISAFVIEESDQGVVARTRDGLINYELVEFFGTILSLLCASHFKILKRSKHTPRVTIDRLVVTREAWGFSAAELGFAHQKEEADRFAGLQRWARDNGIPRFVFVKTPLETKPFYVDFESPILINFFTRSVRNMLSEELEDSFITVSEMLPTPDQLWVTDALGQRYTAELRMVGIEAPV
ncbi:MAG TPA: lantibiotic dehydratase [Pyrinomonadaceae bacterium]